MDSSPPAFTLPPGACDCHCHVFGPARRFPYDPKRRYEPVESPKETLAAMHEGLGVSRAVIVQASAHGTDNSAMLDTLRGHPARYRGVAVIDDRTPDRDLQELDQAGVRGARFNFVKSLGGHPEPETVRNVIARITPLGWHLVLHVQGEDILELSDFIQGLKLPFVIDHMGRVDAARGTAQPAFQRLLDIMEMPGSWIKLSCFERMSAKPYSAALPFAQQLAARFPDRILWGTDFPHPNLKTAVDERDLVQLIPLYAPDPDTRHKLLVENPARLYGFPAS